MTDCDVLEANIRNLQRENRELRQTLRDQFAMAVISGMFAGRPSVGAVAPTPAEWADGAFKVADAMLAARQKPISQPSERTAP